MKKFNFAIFEKIKLNQTKWLDYDDDNSFGYNFGYDDYDDDALKKLNKLIFQV
jgi:hypothetical protein